MYCSALTAADFPACTKIGSYAFNYCSSLTAISFPACTDLGSRPFAACSNLEVVQFPALSTISINDEFASLPKLKEAVFPICKSIYQNVFLDCSRLSAVSFPELVTITPYNATTSQYGTFRNTALKSVYFPKLQSLGANTFHRCSLLSIASFPSCSFIGGYAFYSCVALESLFLLGSTVATLYNKNAFGSTPMSDSSYLGHFGSIYVPASLVDSYKSAANWSLYSARIAAYSE
jgi:hypothetical protein